LPHDENGGFMRVLNGSGMKECGSSRGLGGSLGGTEINTGFSTTQKINNAEFFFANNNILGFFN
jgi:hypothetical protein